MKPSAFKKLTPETQLTKVLIRAGELALSKKYAVDDEGCVKLYTPKFTSLKVKTEDRALSRICDLSVDKGTTLDQVLEVTEKAQVDLMGLLVCAIADLTKDIKFNSQLIALYRNDNVYIDWYNIGSILSKYVNPGTLSLMETAYYGYTKNAPEFNCYCLLNDLDITDTFEDCMQFHMAFEGRPEELLVAIIENIVRNNGQFIPVKVERTLDV